MTILIILFTVLLIVDCMFLGLLILVQLPKKEAGIGMAFGSGATDALFGAGSGTALSNLTSYTATAFFILVFVLSVLSTHAHHPGSTDLKRQIEKMPAPISTTATTPAATNAPAIPLTISTNTAAPAAPFVAPATNVPATPAK